MNNKKICFITCVNDESQYKESLLYINDLRLPDNYEIDIISIKEASCMTEAYNAAIKNTDAKYKVYMHQDVYIINKDFIYDILKIFNESSNIGMMGIVGTSTIPTNGVWWEANDKLGKVYDSCANKMELLNFGDVINDYERVKAIDGLIMITQHDIPWRDDLFDGWHFYDLSQSLEFLKNGFDVVIPRQNQCWCIHDCGIVNTANGYEKYRKIFLDEYLKYI